MKDGSRIVCRNSLGFRFPSGFLCYDFLKNGMADINTAGLSSQGKFLYILKDKSLSIANINYDIIKLTTDSLVIQDVNSDVADSKLIRIPFTRLETHFTDYKPEYNEEIKDSVYHSTDYIFAHDFENGLSKFTAELSHYFAINGELTLSFIIKKSGRMVNLKVIRNDSISNDVEKTALDCFKRLNGYWKPASVNQKHANVEAEVTVSFYQKGRSGGSSIHGVNWSTSFSAMGNKYPDLPLNLLGEEQSAFNEGIDMAKKQNYDVAIARFSRCIEIDEINLDAYYLRAAIYFKKGDNAKACADWQKLSQLGQVLATKCLAKYCK